MKGNIRFLSALLCSIVAISTASHATMSNDVFLQPYTGVDLGRTNYKFQDGFGHNIFKKNYPKANFFVGTKVNKFVGVELGVDRTSNKGSDASLVTGDVALGDAIPAPFSPTVVNAKAKFSGWHVNFVGTYPVTEQENLSLIGSVGLKRASVKLQRDILSLNGVDQNQQQIIDQRLELSQTKTIKRFSAGMQHFFNSHVGIRALATWENSAKLKPVGVEPGTGVDGQAKVKNAFGYTIGVVIK